MLGSLAGHRRHRLSGGFHLGGGRGQALRQGRNVRLEALGELIKHLSTTHLGLVLNLLRGSKAACLNSIVLEHLQRAGQFTDFILAVGSRNVNGEVSVSKLAHRCGHRAERAYDGEHNNRPEQGKRHEDAKGRGDNQRGRGRGREFLSVLNRCVESFLINVHTLVEQITQLAASVAPFPIGDLKRERVLVAQGVSNASICKGEVIEDISLQALGDGPTFGSCGKRNQFIGML